MKKIILPTWNTCIILYLWPIGNLAIVNPPEKPSNNRFIFISSLLTQLSTSSVTPSMKTTCFSTTNFPLTFNMILYLHCSLCLSSICTTDSIFLILLSQLKKYWWIWVPWDRPREEALKVFLFILFLSGFFITSACSVKKIEAKH